MHTTRTGCDSSRTAFHKHVQRVVGKVKLGKPHAAESLLSHSKHRRPVRHGRHARWWELLMGRHRCRWASSGTDISALFAVHTHLVVHSVTAALQAAAPTGLGARVARDGFVGDGRCGHGQESAHQPQRTHTLGAMVVHQMCRLRRRVRTSSLKLWKCEN
jgi:hypothetical protein